LSSAPSVEAAIFLTRQLGPTAGQIDQAITNVRIVVAYFVGAILVIARIWGECKIRPYKATEHNLFRVYWAIHPELVEGRGRSWFDVLTTNGSI
jgi:hypothetical protein